MIVSFRLSISPRSLRANSGQSFLPVAIDPAAGRAEDNTLESRKSTRPGLIGQAAQ
jgi:hypothetical protein